jgi:hypothetical protein
MARLTLNIDQDSFDGAGFEPVPVGPYRVNIYSIDVREVKTGDHKGKPRLNFQFRVQDGQTSPEGKKQGNRRLFVELNAFEMPNKKDPSKMNAPFELIAIGKAIGLDREQINDLNTEDWLGKELQLSVAAHEEKLAKNPATGKYDIKTGTYREVIKGFRSVESAGTAAAASAAVLAKAGSAKTGSAANSQFSL